MNKKNNKLLLFFLFSFFMIISFSNGYSNGLDSIGKKVNWPVEKTKTISSPFGMRKDPFGSGKTFFHNGIDIAAPEGEKLIALEDGEVTRTSFYGGYGYTICIKGKDTNIVYLYGHVDPNFIVKKGMKIAKGDVIGKVGPFNVKIASNNPFRDFKGNPTNGMTTGSHLHFSIINNGKFIDPFIYLKKLKN